MLAEATAIRPFQMNVPEADLHRSAPAGQGNEVARERNRERPFAGRPAGDDEGGLALLGDGLRWRKVRRG